MSCPPPAKHDACRSGRVSPDGSRGRLYFTVGLPRAAKSTFANRWAREPGPRPRVVIGGDDFRLALHGAEYAARAEATVFAAMDTATLALLERGFDVLVDETSTSVATLTRYLRIDPAAEPVFVDTPAAECRRRAVASGKPFLVAVIDRLEPQLAGLRANWAAVRADVLARLEHRYLPDTDVWRGESDAGRPAVEQEPAGGPAA